MSGPRALRLGEDKMFLLFRGVRSRPTAKIVPKMFPALAVIASLGVYPPTLVAQSSRPAEVQTATRKEPPNYVSAEELNERGIQLAQKGDQNRAIEDFEAATRLRSDFAAAFLNLGTAYLERGKRIRETDEDAYYRDLEQALDALRRASDLTPQIGKIHESLGWIYQEIGDFPTALAEFRKAVALDPKSQHAYENLGTALEHNNQFPEAIGNYERAVALDPNSVTAEQNLSTLIQMHGDKESVLQSRQAAVEHSDSPVAHMLFGDALYFTGNLPAASSELRTAIRLSPNLVFAHLVLGRVLMARGQSKQALEQFATAEKLNPNASEVRSDFASALLNAGQNERAILEAKKLIEHDPADSSAHYLLARALKASGKSAEASSEFRRTQSLISAKGAYTQARVHLLEGITALKRRQLAEAITDLQQAVATKPDYPEANYYLGIALAQNGDSQPAIRAFNKALQRRPKSAEIHYNYGIALWHMGRETEAVSQLKIASSLNPADGLAHCALGKALIKQGQIQQGTNELSKAHSLGACTQEPGSPAH